MRFRRGKSSNKAKKGSSAPLQNGERKVDGGGGSNSRQVAPDTRVGSIDCGSSREETFFEACPWLDSDCEDDFYSVNGDLTLARSISSQHNKTTPSSGPPKLPTPGAILKAEPLKPPPPQRKLADLLLETQDGDGATGGPADLSRADSFRLGEDAGRCCVPQFPRAISCNGRGRRKK